MLRKGQEPEWEILAGGRVRGNGAVVVGAP